ncbi:hypothetical protein [Hanstruepera marina]|uniref:hypothetical protein n=1 Tax=Hanstruepera marina TaxID=2873265 RepID=UPI001CA7A110|nr:hypothetical protein [Hanstruepera marina]
MKNLICLACFLITLVSFSQKDFILTIGDESHEIALDESNEFKVNGKAITISVREKDTLVYEDSFYNFKYIKDYSISKTVLEEGIEQIMIMTASGSGVLIQKYEAFDPTMLQEMMLNEVTKESISYGYTMERQDYERALVSGQKLEILKSVLEYKGEIETYEITALGGKDEGILIMTMNMNDEIDPEGVEMINLMWNSLHIK